MMITAFRESQLLLLVCVFALACAGKLMSPKDRQALLFAGVEAGLCVLLLVSADPLVRLVTAMVLVAATWVLGDLRTSRPEEGCGCFGVLSSSRIGKRTVIRTGLLAVAAMLTFGLERHGLQVLGDSLGWRGLMFGAELAFFLVISPEPALLLRRTEVPCDLRRVPLSVSLGMLHSSEAWQEYEAAASKYFKAGQRPTIAETVAYYRERKIGLVMFTVDTEFEMGVRRIPNQEVVDAARENSDMMVAFASIDPHKGKMGVREARRLIEEGGIRGFKFHPTCQGFFPNDRFAYKLYEVNLSVQYESSPMSLGPMGEYLTGLEAQLGLPEGE